MAIDLAIFMNRVVKFSSIRTIDTESLRFVAQRMACKKLVQLACRASSVRGVVPATKNRLYPIWRGSLDKFFSLNMLKVIESNGPSGRNVS